MMKKFFELGNRYAAESNWKDFALTKFCLCAIGVIIGLLLPSRVRTAALIIAGAVFAITYILLMKKVAVIAGKMFRESKKKM